MEGNKILSADILDIIFEGRNKEYGAYDLRKTYDQRVKKALLFTATFCALLFAGYLFANNFRPASNAMMVVEDFDLAKLEEKKEEVIKPPPVKPPEVQKVEIKAYTAPVIVNQELKEDERPPDVQELEETKIGAINQEGTKDDGLIAPPVDDGNKGVIEAPKKERDPYDDIFTSVQIESSYPEGDGAWRRYLNKNLRYPQQALDNEIQGVVIVQFLVDKDGYVSNVEVLSGPEELREEAVRVIKKSGKWIPGNQNGRSVKSYKKQPIGFKINIE